MKSSLLFLPILATLLCVSCVHEFPDVNNAKQVVLKVSHATDWTYYDMTVTRGDKPAYAPIATNAHARYHIQVFRQGDISNLVYETEIFNPDLSREDFTTVINLNPGDYDLYVWSDYADNEKQSSFFFNSSDFSQVLYSEPYNGNNELRDAFRGMVSFSVNTSMEEAYYKEVEVELERPLARYEFISTDLKDFFANETTRTLQLAANQDTATKGSLDGSPDTRVDLGNYSVRMIYAAYMPSIFDNFQNKPIDSSVGMEYMAEITKLNDEEARLGFDYVMVNGRESSIKVQMEIYDQTGDVIGRTNPIDVVTKRNMNTTVRGNFLTSKVSGGVEIDPDFDGQFNIPIN